MNPKINKELIWLKKRKEFLSIDKIEKEIECPSTTIAQWLSEKRELPGKWHQPVVNWVKRFKK